jgi:hypothetical protein
MGKRSKKGERGSLISLFSSQIQGIFAAASALRWIWRHVDNERRGCDVCVWRMNAQIRTLLEIKRSCMGGPCDRLPLTSLILSRYIAAHMHTCLALLESSTCNFCKILVRIPIDISVVQIGVDCLLFDFTWSRPMRFRVLVAIDASS